MSKSAAIRASDVRAAYLLAAECRELGDAPALWREHFLNGLARMTGAGFGVSAEVGDGKQSSRHDLGTIDSGDGKGFDRPGWLRMLEEFQTNAFFNPFMNAYFDRAIPGTCRARNDLVPDREWYGSFYYRGFRMTLGADASLLCLRPIPGTRDDHDGLYLLRAKGERDFGGRDRALVEEAMAAVGPQIGGPLARFVAPSPSALPPRLRQVLKCVLEGDSDKLVATRLGLSRYTVNEYLQTIFRHFGVRSRPELLARWVRRGWGGRFAWADPAADGPLADRRS